MKRNLTKMIVYSKNSSLFSWIRQASFYFVVSGIAMLLNITFRNIIELVLPFNISVVIAYLIGSVIKFFLSKNFVFNAKLSNNTGKEFIRYIIVSFIGMTVTYFVSIYALDIITNYELIANQVIRNNVAHLLGLAIGFTINFFGHKLFSFESSRRVK